MSIIVPLSPDEEATLLAQAKAQGLSVDALLRRAVLQIIHPAELSARSKQQLSGEEFELAFDELSRLVPDDVPPISSEALRRENLYRREDDE